jgi:hypothetical protein
MHMCDDILYKNVFLFITVLPEDGIRRLKRVGEITTTKGIGIN